jgi:hypothetical protein
MHARSIVMLLGSFFMAGCAATGPSIVAEGAPSPQAAKLAPPSPAPAKRSEPAEPGPVYRLDFVVTSGDGAKPATSGTYTINLEENRSGDIHMGMNVPLTPTGSARQDVGIKLHCHFQRVGDDLLFHDNMEMSALEEPSTIRKISVNGNALISPGKPALVASAEDVATHRRYQVMVTATKLR